jgi:hypothetical protein
MSGETFLDSTTCAVCGLARGTRAQLACGCRGWVAFWRLALRDKNA